MVSERGKRTGRVRLRGRRCSRSAAAWAVVPTAEGAIEDRYFRASDGVRLHYRSAGRGPRTLVLVPGWLMPAEVFDAQMKGLADRYRVVALSPRSQGGSQLHAGPHTGTLRARDIRDFLRHLAPPRFVLAGWSLGVLEVLICHRRHRLAGLRGLVLIDNSIGEGPPPAASLGELLPADMTEPARQAFMRDFARGLFKTVPAGGLLEAVERSALRAPLSVARGLLAPWYPRESYRRTVRGTSVPVWYAITPRFAAQAECLKAARPATCVTVYPEAGHALFVDEAASFNEDLDAFAAPLFQGPPGRRAAKG